MDKGLHAINRQTFTCLTMRFTCLFHFFDFAVEQKYDIGDLYDGEKLLSALGKPLFVNKKDVTSTKVS